MKNLCKVLGIITLIVFVVFSFAACDNPADDDGGGNLVLASGYAWTDYFEYGEGDSDGYIFTSAGIVYEIDNYDGPWEVVGANPYSDGPWEVVGANPYSTSGNKLTAFGSTVPYSVSGDTLTINGDYILKKTQVGDILP